MKSLKQNENRLLEILEGINLKLPTLIGLVGLFAYFEVASVWSEEGKYGNIQIYAGSVAVFFVVLAISAFTLTMIRRKCQIGISENISKIGALLVLTVGGWFLVRCYFNELDKYAFPAKYFRHIIPGWIYLVILLAFCGMIFMGVRRFREQNKYCRGLLSALIAFVQGWFLYTPNPFLDNLGSITHIDAYTNSILNTVAYAPLEMYSSSIYGHHGLIYFLPIKMLHKIGLTYWNALAITIGIVGFITFLIQYWCLSQMIENDWIFFVSVFANAVVSFQIYSNQYFQMMPHRYFFQAIIMCGCIIAYRKSSSHFVKASMWGMCSLSMLWNIETGIVVTIIWLLASVYLDGKEKQRYLLADIIKNAVFFVIAFVAGYGMVNMYNLAVGGNTINLSTYIYPLGSNTYPIDMLELTLMKPDNGYFMVIALMLGAIGLYLMQTLLIRLSEQQYIALLSSIMGIGVFMYYMNRAVTTNATIVAFSMVLVMGHFCDRFVGNNSDEVVELSKNEIGKKIWKQMRIRFSVGIICMVVLSGLALASISSIGSTVKNKISTTWDSGSINAFAEEANAAIPDDTVAFGAYTAQLFALMNRTTGIYIADWQDMGTSWANTIMNSEAYEKLDELLRENKYEHVLVYADNAGYLPEGEYAKISEIEYNERVFELYERKNVH